MTYKEASRLTSVGRCAMSLDNAITNIDVWMIEVLSAALGDNP